MNPRRPRRTRRRKKLKSRMSAGKSREEALTQMLDYKEAKFRDKSNALERRARALAPLDWDYDTSPRRDSSREATEKGNRDCPNISNVPRKKIKYHPDFSKSYEEALRENIHLTERKIGGITSSIRESRVRSPLRSMRWDYDTSPEGERDRYDLLSSQFTSAGQMFQNNQELSEADEKGNNTGRYSFELEIHSTTGKLYEETLWKNEGELEFRDTTSNILRRQARSSYCDYETFTGGERNRYDLLSSQSRPDGQLFQNDQELTEVAEKIGHNGPNLSDTVGRNHLDSQFNPAGQLSHDSQELTDAAEKRDHNGPFVTRKWTNPFRLPQATSTSHNRPNLTDATPHTNMFEKETQNQQAPLLTRESDAVPLSGAVLKGVRVGTEFEVSTSQFSPNDQVFKIGKEITEDVKNVNLKQPKLSGAARKRLKRLHKAGMPYEEALKQILDKRDKKFDAKYSSLGDNGAQALKAPEPTTQLKVGTYLPRDEQAKRLRMSNRDIIFSGMEVGILPKTFPTQTLDPNQLELVRKWIRKAVCNIPDDGPQVRFLGFKNEPGWFLITCADEVSRYWLTENVGNIKPWVGADLKTVEGNSIPKQVVYEVFVPDDDDVTSQETVLLRLSKQNKRLNASDWIVLDRKVAVKGQILTLSICHSSIKALEDLDFSPYYELGRLYFKLSN